MQKSVGPPEFEAGVNGFALLLQGKRRVECTLCRRRLREGAVGACGMRFNLGGALYTAAYGLSTAAESRPMEISQGGVWM
ncbi:MAG: hypothetical protein ACO2PM_10850 [Pyrobaculum sp.]|jgi:hypothetical protein